MFTPVKTVGYENQVAHYAYQAMNISGHKPMEGPLRLHVIAVFPKPASWSKKKAAEIVWHTGKPDGDNILKACGDALNGIVWRDDSQVAHASIIKAYSEDSTACLRVTIEPLGEP
jgi:Holliday junction resolvase RusA-like endonuclease